MTQRQDLLGKCDAARNTTGFRLTLILFISVLQAKRVKTSLVTRQLV